MKHRSPHHTKLIVAVGLLVVIALIGGCATEPEPVERHVVATVVVEREVKVESSSGHPLPTPAPDVAAPGEPGEDGSSAPLASPYRVNRMVIKNAELRLVVESTRVGIDRVTQVAEDAFGYILSSRTWYEGGFQYATMTISVPVDEFENAMRRIRGLALRVADEHASGTDVSDQYVDLESRLRNLEATEARIRSFLEQAANVEESLRINQQLTEITAQIEAVKGKMSYLKDRAAYSTLTVHLVPEVPTPTPAPTSTPTPTPTPVGWRPDKTFRSASGVLSSILQALGDLLIWVLVVLGPFAVPAAGLLWIIVSLQRRRNRKR